MFQNKACRVKLSKRKLMCWLALMEFHEERPGKTVYVTICMLAL